MSDIETGYDVKAMNARRTAEVNGAVLRPQATISQARTTFPSRGADALIHQFTGDEDMRTEMEFVKHAPLRCAICLMPAHSHAVFGGEINHLPALVDEARRTAGMTRGAERYDENRADSPNRRARREPGEFFLAIDDPAYEAAQARWNRATARHRADPDNPANWR